DIPDARIEPNRKWFTNTRVRLPALPRSSRTR
ncbi:hypothetical protein IMZ48_44070, partial [Candidatus Bathyarchaeota archaeon]|nr:hypothetical protein [Candidatus Bathyarchaeota archaeon]